MSKCVDFWGNPSKRAESHPRRPNRPHRGSKGPYGRLSAATENPHAPKAFFPKIHIFRPWPLNFPRTPSGNSAGSHEESARPKPTVGSNFDAVNFNQLKIDGGGGILRVSIYTYPCFEPGTFAIWASEITDGPRRK